MSFFFHDTATTEIYTLSLPDALLISDHARNQETELDGALEVGGTVGPFEVVDASGKSPRSEEHTSELQSQA